MRPAHDHGHAATPEHPRSHPHPHGLNTPPDSRDLLRSAKLRVTGVRLAVLEVLAASDQAINAQQVYDALLARTPKGRARATKPDRVTVYRTLNALVESGVAHKLDPGDRVFRFRLTDHARCQDHHHDHEHPHFVCDDCGIVQCLDGATVQITQPAGTAPHHAKVRRTVRQDVMLHGTCENCGENQPPEPRRRSKS